MLAAHGAERVLLQPGRDAFDVVEVGTGQPQHHTFGEHFHVADAAVLGFVDNSLWYFVDLLLGQWVIGYGFLLG